MSLEFHWQLSNWVEPLCLRTPWPLPLALLYNIKHKIELKQGLFQAEVGETVPDFFKRCKNAQDQLCDLFYSELLNERELLLNFVNGLRPKIQDALLENEEDTETLEAALEAAIKIEASLYHDANT